MGLAAVAAEDDRDAFGEEAGGYGHAVAAGGDEWLKATDVVELIVGVIDHDAVRVFGLSDGGGELFVRPAISDGIEFFGG